MNRYFTRIFLFSLVLKLSVFCPLALAHRVDNLYQVSLNAADTTQITRNKLLPLAFDELLLKVGNDRAIVLHNEVAVAKQHIDKYVDGYSYKQNENDYSLIVNFNEKMINQLMQKMNSPSLGKDRPKVLLILDSDVADETNDKIDSLAKRYAIPIVINQPNAQSTITPVQATSYLQKYKADVVLIGSVKQIYEQWHCAWQLLDKDPNSNMIAWDSKNLSLDEQLESMMDQLSSQLLVKYAKPVSVVVNNNMVSLTIKEVKGLNEYAMVSNYLKNLSVVKKIQVQSIKSNEVQFALDVEGGKQAIVAAISSDPLLRQEPITDESQTLLFRVNT